MEIQEELIKIQFTLSLVNGQPGSVVSRGRPINYTNFVFARVSHLNRPKSWGEGRGSTGRVNDGDVIYRVVNATVSAFRPFRRDRVTKVSETAVTVYRTQNTIPHCRYAVPRGAFKSMSVYGYAVRKSTLRRKERDIVRFNVSTRVCSPLSLGPPRV